jgi:hypothetical protein
MIRAVPRALVHPPADRYAWARDVTNWTNISALATGFGTLLLAVVDDDNCGVVYLAASLRNAGNGIAVLHGWLFYPGDYRGNEHPDPGTFTRSRSPGTGTWTGPTRGRTMSGGAR